MRKVDAPYGKQNGVMSISQYLRLVYHIDINIDWGDINRSSLPRVRWKLIEYLGVLTTMR